MQLKQKHIDELKEIYYKNTGVRLTNADAWEMGMRLINLYCLLMDIQPDGKVRTSSNLPQPPKN